MNNMKLVVSVLFLGGAIGLSRTSARADIMTSASARGVISQYVLTEGSYCHIKFPAIGEQNLLQSCFIMPAGGYEFAEKFADTKQGEIECGEFGGARKWE